LIGCLQYNAPHGGELSNFFADFAGFRRCANVSLRTKALTAASSAKSRFIASALHVGAKNRGGRAVKLIEQSRHLALLRRRLLRTEDTF
jgi:hypothetical protein